MNYFYRLLLVFWLPCSLAFAQADHPVVRIQTNQGDITLELDYTHAPKSVENFLGYAREGFYEGTIFHRVIDNFIIQAGGYTEAYEKKDILDPVQSEADNGVQNLRGTVALARGANPHSASSQFFINMKDNANLDFKNESARGYGYTVFAKVTAGMDVAEKIQQIPVGEGGPFKKFLPTEPVVISKVVIEQDLPATPEENEPEAVDETEDSAQPAISEPEAETTAPAEEAVAESTTATSAPPPAPLPGDAFLHAPEPPDLPAVE